MFVFLDDEFFFIESDGKISKVAPDGWKEDPKKRKTDINFTLFLRIKFFHDDVSFIQYVTRTHRVSRILHHTQKACFDIIKFY